MQLRRIDVESAESILYPVPPVLVAVWNGELVNGMVAAWWMQVSFKPLLVAVAVAPERFTYRLIMEQKFFSINVLGEKHAAALAYAGDISGRFAPEKLEKAGLRFFRGEATGAPILEDALAALELRLVKTVEAGDHDILVAEVEAAYASEAFDEETERWNPENHKPLLYLGSEKTEKGVRRYYLVPTSYHVIEVDAPPSELREAYEKRRSMLRELRRAAGEARDPADLRARVKRIVERYGLDELDLEYLYRDALRRFKLRR